MYVRYKVIWLNLIVKKDFFFFYKNEKEIVMLNIEDNFVFFF